MCFLRDHNEIEHGDIRIGFNPDEEIGKGAHHSMLKSLDVNGVTPLMVVILVNLNMKISMLLELKSLYMV